MNEHSHQSIHDLGVGYIQDPAQRVSKTEIFELVRRSRAMSYTEVQALNRIYGPHLNKLQRVGADENATNLFLPLLEHVFDKGTLRGAECVIPPFGNEGKKVVIKEKAVPIHTRSSFISKILEEKNSPESPPISIARLDLKRFRDADFDVGSKDGTRPADVIISTTARVMREALKEVLGKRVAEKSCSYEVGRYGGDELIIAFIGNVTDSEKEATMQHIYMKMSREKGYYKNKETGEIEEGGIYFKEDPKLITTDNKDTKVEWIAFPDDADENVNTMYKEYVMRGLILNAEDFKRECAKYTKKGESFDFSAYRTDFPEDGTALVYPKNTNTISEKITYLLKKHPELAPYFHLAQIFDKEEEAISKDKSGNISRQKELLSIIEGSIFDRLLGDMIYSRPYFIEHMGKNEIGELHIIDFKFLKEMNGAMTYADADNSIKALYEKINNAIPYPEQKNIIISRFAGAIFVGVKKDVQLSQQCREALNSINTLALGDKNTQYDVPLGNAYINLDENSNLLPYEIISKIEAAADKSYYKSLVQDILNEERSSEGFIARMMGQDLNAITKQSNESYKTLSKNELYALALLGPRKIARIGAFIDSTHSEFNKNPTYQFLEHELRSAISSTSKQ